ncbi:hypothetical protein AB5J62_33355 [Amycolatopsis sp. cg5]|uniref:hypothetical protein n=1 Tax=Amycolatopsis sp. cg5 TaxID=3238802 RepID=UPI0035255169
MADHFCSIATRFRKVESVCGKEATHFVTYFNDGTEGRYCCTPHLGRAVDAVLGDPRTSKRRDATVNRVRKEG